MKKLITSLSLAAIVATGAIASEDIETSIEMGVKNGSSVAVASISSYDTAIWGDLVIPYVATMEIASDKQFNVEAATIIGEPSNWGYVYGGAGFELTNRVGVTAIDSKEINVYGKLGVYTGFTKDSFTVAVNPYIKAGNAAYAGGVDFVIPVSANTAFTANVEKRYLSDTNGGAYEITTTSVVAGISYKF